MENCHFNDPPPPLTENLQLEAFLFHSQVLIKSSWQRRKLKHQQTAKWTI